MSDKSTSELAAAMASLRPYFKTALGYSIVAGLLLLSPTAFMLEVYDRVVNSRNHLTLVMLIIAVIGAYAVMELVEWARGQTLHAAGLALEQKIGDRVFNVTFAANLRRLPGGTAQTISDLRTIRDFIGSPAVTAAMEAPVALVFLILLYAISPVLGWVALAGALAQVIVGIVNERATNPPLVAANRSAIAAQIYADGSMRNAQVIESMGMQRDIHRRWMEKQREFLTLQAVASDRAGGYQSLTKFLQTTMSSGLLGLAAWLLLNRSLNGGGSMMIIASLLGGRLLAPLVMLVAQWRTVINVRDAWRRLNTLLMAVPARLPSMPLPAPRGFVQAEQVVVSPPGSSVPILRGVGFALQPGEVLVVVGASASGKTTLARALVGIWPSGGGKVRLDGVDVFNWDKQELGPHVGYLSQGIELFDGTLAENIARFGDIEMAKVHAAAKSVGLHDFIMSLPEGYDSPAGREGTMLSGGQRQRVGLARAIYGDPVFVVLDEPNSSLDEAGEASLAAAIGELKSRGTTFVVMTHRPSVLNLADKMLVLRDGQTQAYGPRDDVLAALAKAAAQVKAAQSAKALPDATAAAAAG